MNVLADKPKVLALTLGGLAPAWTADRGHQAALTGLDDKDGTVLEMNTEVLVVSGGKVGHFASRELSGERTMSIVLARHAYAFSNECPGIRIQRCR